jgi:hypothetical protein
MRVRYNSRVSRKKGIHPGEKLPTINLRLNLCNWAVVGLNLRAYYTIILIGVESSVIPVWYPVASTTSLIHHDKLPHESGRGVTRCSSRQNDECLRGRGFFPLRLMEG